MSPSRQMCTECNSSARRYHSLPLLPLHNHKEYVKYALLLIVVFVVFLFLVKNRSHFVIFGSPSVDNLDNNEECPGTV